MPHNINKYDSIFPDTSLLILAEIPSEKHQMHYPYHSLYNQGEDYVDVRH